MGVQDQGLDVMADGSDFLGGAGRVLEVVRQWSIPGLLAAILAIVLRYRLGARKLEIDAQAVDVSALEVRQAEEANIRDHYAEEVRQLRERIDSQAERHRRERDEDEVRHRLALAAADQAHKDCVEAREDLRDKVSALKDQVAALIRIILQNQVSGALRLDPENLPPEIREAAQRVDAIFARQLGKPKEDPS